MLSGGAGADRFLFGDLALAGTDRILDFDRAEGDRIVLRGLDAVAATPGGRRLGGGRGIALGGPRRRRAMPCAVVTHKGSDTGANRDAARRRGICPVIPYRADAARRPGFFPKALCRARARIEQIIGRPNCFKRIAPRPPLAPTDGLRSEPDVDPLLVIDCEPLHAPR